MKKKLEDYNNLSFDEKVDFIKSTNEMSLEDVVKIKDILDITTDPEEAKDNSNLSKGFDWLTDNDYFKYFLYATFFVWAVFLLNLFTGFNFRTFLVALFS